MKRVVITKSLRKQNQGEQHSHYRCYRRREKGEENIFEEIIAEHFRDLGNEADIQMQESQRFPNEIWNNT